MSSSFRCIGSTQHLKDRHGSGYILEVKLGHNKDGATSLAAGDTSAARDEFVQGVEDELFPGATLVESFAERITLKVPHQDVSALSRVFTWMEEGKKYNSIQSEKMQHRMK